MPSKMIITQHHQHGESIVVHNPTNIPRINEHVWFSDIRRSYEVTDVIYEIEGPEYDKTITIFVKCEDID